MQKWTTRAITPRWNFDIVGLQSYKEHLELYREASVLCRGFVFILVAVLPGYALAWFDVGHEVVAEIAWRSLDDQTREKVKVLLKELSPIYEHASSLTTLSKLPDHMRTGFKIFDSWHYVDLPYIEIPLSPPAPTANGAIWALCESTRTITKPKSINLNDPFAFAPKPFERAFMLPFLVHIVGDLHQPLHAISRHTGMNSGGDKGGNLFLIKLDKYVSNLHSYWDSGLGIFADVREAPHLIASKSKQTDDLASRFMNEYTRKHFGERVENVNFSAWALESHNLAKSISYNLIEGSEPGKTYIEQGQKTVRERVTLAGYRLAYLLTHLLADKPVNLATGCQH